MLESFDPIALIVSSPCPTVWERERVARLPKGEREVARNVGRAVSLLCVVEGRLPKHASSRHRQEQIELLRRYGFRVAVDGRRWGFFAVSCPNDTAKLDTLRTALALLADDHFFP